MSTIDSKASGAGGKPVLITLAVLLVALAVLFWRSFVPSDVVFSNDGPLAGLVQDQNQLPETFTGAWRDLNSIGQEGGAAAPAISTLLRMVLGPVGFAKFFAPIALLIVGVGAWTFFRALKFSQTVAVLGALAAMLNNTFFSAACWGVAAQQIALGMNFFALTLIVSNTSETPAMLRYARLALAGLCVGMNVMEAADIGALYSILIAVFVFYRTVTGRDGAAPIKAARGVGHVAIVAIFAGFIAIQTVVTLVGTQIQGVAGTSQEAKTKAERWDFATQWSLPKAETLSLAVPGLFGYKMDTPKDMMPMFQSAYRNGNYWGGIGRDPSLDRYFDSGRQGPPPQSSFMRFSGGGVYCGILVWLVVAWVVAQSLRKTGFVPADQKRMIWFWAVVMLFCLPMAWGRFAPFSHSSDDFLFYAFLYKLPYFSTIRNPAKFVVFVSMGSIILFGYGTHFLSRHYFQPSTANGTTGGRRWPNGFFDRNWVRAMFGLFGVNVIAWVIFGANAKKLADFLQTVGFEDPVLARDIARFSVSQAGWFLVFLAGAIVLLSLVLSGYFAGQRSRLAAVLIGLFLFVDLGRANLPYVGHWNYRLKYDVGNLNPVLRFLAEKPYENRVAILPFRAPQQFALFEQLYRIEWAQHHFQYYDIQSLDIVQMPRVPQDLENFETALQFRGTPETMHLVTRRWALTSTRYLLGPAGFIEALNQQIDPQHRRFRILQTFNVVPKAGIANPTKLEELTVEPAGTNGNYALFEFTGALPRAKLFSNWQMPAKDPAMVTQLQHGQLDTNDLAFLKGIGTNDFLMLQRLADPAFEPHKTVLLADNVAVPAASGAFTNAEAGTVEYASYSPKVIRLKANSRTGGVLLLNDKFDPNWKVTVDDKPADLLRCNYIMRGVYVPAGEHLVTFAFRPDVGPLYITIAGEIIGVALLGFVCIASRKRPEALPAKH